MRITRIQSWQIRRRFLKCCLKTFGPSFVQTLVIVELSKGFRIDEAQRVIFTESKEPSLKPSF